MKFTKLLAAALLSTAMIPAVRVMPAQALLPAGETSATDKAAAGKAAEKAENAAATAGQTAGEKDSGYTAGKNGGQTAGQTAGGPATEITIYNQDLALIKKRQQVKLNKGINEVVFDEVARQMRPESAFIFGDGVKILEQNYDYAGVNYMNMLSAFVGKEVKTVRTNPATGENIYEKAILLAADGMSPVLKFDYGIETNFPGRVLFDKVPLGLNSTPVLKARAETAEAGEKELRLAYLTSGFSWEANYVAKVNDEKTLELLGRVSLSNSSGSAYDNVSVNLIAGDVNTVGAVLQPRMFKRAMVNAMALGAAMDTMEAAPVISAPQNLNGYYIYKIPQPTSLKDGQIKQVSFVNAPAVKYKKRGVVDSTLSFGKNKSFYKDVHPNLIYNFTNNAEDGLGMPLPKGKISFYDYDKNGALQFVGENTIDNKAEGQRLTLNLGKFFDVYAEAKVDGIQKLSERKYKKNPADTCVTAETTNLYETIYRVTNKAQYPADIVLKQPMPADAKIVKESIKGEAGDGNEHVWRFTVAPGATQELKASIQNKLEQRDCGVITLVE